MEFAMRILTSVIAIMFTAFLFASGVQAQCWEETQKIIASDGTSQDYFGYSVAIDGDVMVVGAIHDDDSIDYAGSAYVYRFEPIGSVWVEEAKLLTSDASWGDSFGCAVSIDGDVIVIGAYGDGDNDAYTGSAYVFRYEPIESVWVEEAKLLASDGASEDYFGRTISIDGDMIVVGSPYSAEGAVYVYRYEPVGSVWVEEAKLLASDVTAGDRFGYSVSIDGDVIVMGATEDDDNGDYSGSAYVFRYDGSGWLEETKLLASDGAEWDRFGFSVSIDGDVIVVGAPCNDDNEASFGSGYVYRYDPVGSEWVEEVKLLVFDRGTFDDFGRSVSIDGSAIVIGANGYHVFSGASYVFRYESVGSEWVEEARLVAFDGDPFDGFGHSVSIDGDVIAVGAWKADSDNGFDSGSAYVFDLTTIHCPTLTVSPDPLIAGQNAMFVGNSLHPNEEAFLAYSLGGFGNTYIPQLNVMLDLRQPAQAGNTIISDGNGVAEWVLFVPGAGIGRDVWFQACQYEVTTNVVETHIE